MTRRRQRGKGLAPPGELSVLGVARGLAGRVPLAVAVRKTSAHLLLGKDLGGWRGLLPTAVAA